MESACDFSSDRPAWLAAILAAARSCTELAPEALAKLQGYIDSHFSLDGEVLSSTPTAVSLTPAQLCQKMWCFVSREVLLPPPQHSMATHQTMLAAVYAAWNRQELGPFPVWSPSFSHLAAHNLTHFLQNFSGDAEFERARGSNPAADWQQLHALSVRDPECVWRAVLLHTLALPLHQHPTRMLRVTANPDECEWLPGARMNVAWCALHAPRGTPVDADTQPAVMWADEGSPCAPHSMSRLQLRAMSLQVAACLRTRIQPGDPVAIIMPMTPLAVATYLGCVLAGCPVVSIADSFAAHEIEARLRISRAALVITQDNVVRGGKPLPLLPRVLAAAACPPVVVVPSSADLAALLAYPWDGTAAMSTLNGAHGNCNGHSNGHGGSIRYGAHHAQYSSQHGSGQNGNGHGNSGNGNGYRQGQHGRGSSSGSAWSHTNAAKMSPAQHDTGKLQPARPQSQPQLRAGDMTWLSFITLANPQLAQHAAFQPAASAPGCLHVAGPQEASNILFSSGTTGEPKAIVWDHAAPLRCAADGWAHQNIQPGDRVCWPTSLGWMMGPWLVYAALLNGACITLYNGAPLGRDFGQFVAAARVNVLGLVPSIVRTWRHSGCMSGLDWPELKCISSTGEASAPDDYHWLYALTRYRAPVIEYCGGTELAGAYITATSLQHACPSTFSTPALGTQLVLLAAPPAPLNSQQQQQQQATSFGANNQLTVQVDDRQVQLSPHGPSAAPAVGEVALLAPSLGASQRLLNKDHFKVYYEGMPAWPVTGRPLRRHGDELVRLPGGYYSAMGRVDDTMNLGGIKVASVELERAVMEKVQDVAEVAAVAVPSAGGGPERLVLFAVLRSSSSSSQPGSTPSAASLLSSCQAAIRSELNPLFKVDQVVVLSSLPRNASNKLMRRVLRDQLVQQQQPRSKL